MTARCPPALRPPTLQICRALEELLEDEDDLLDMNLTAKEQRELDLMTRISTAIEEGSEVRSGG